MPARSTLFPLLTLLLLAGWPGALVGSTTSTARLIKEKDVIVYHDAKFYSAFPSVVERPGGELLCAFRRAPSRRHLHAKGGDAHTDANSYLVAVRSRDKGETWTTTPELLYAHAFGGSQDPCLLQMHDGTLLCTSYGWAPLTAEEKKVHPKAFHEPGFGFLGGYIVRSLDSRTWTPPTYPPVVPGNYTQSAIGGDLPAYNRGALLQRKDGTILWAVARHDSLSPMRTSVHLLRSEDGGTSWSYGGVIATDPSLSFNETSLVETRDGKVAAFLRTTAPGMKAAMAVSSDGGESFAPWQDLGWGGLPLQAIPLKQGGILLVYGYRQKPFGIRARLLRDDLSDAATAPELVLRDDGGNADLGYPWAVELSDGRVLVVYYINQENGPRHIAATLLRVAPPED